VAFPAAGAAEAPVLAELLVDLLVLLGWVVCLGLLWAWRHTIGAALRAAGSALDFKVLGVKIPLGLPLEKLDDVVTSNLGAYANATHRAVGYFWAQAAHLQSWIGDEIASTAEDMYGWAEWLQHRHLPTWAKWAMRAAFPVAYLTKLIAGELRKVLPHTTKVATHAAGSAVTVIERTIVKPVSTRVVHLTKIVYGAGATAAVAAVGAVTIPWAHVHVFPRLRSLEHARWRHNARLKRLEKILAAAGAAAIMANALGLPNWRCITRGNLGRASRAICGLESGLFAALLAGLVLVETPLSLEELAHEYLSVFDDALGLVVGAVDEVKGYV
jgi:hypothetical protein